MTANRTDKKVNKKVNKKLNNKIEKITTNITPNITTTYPSIFNDVIGPVMRGPSSSHCAAALRIGRLARDLMEGDLQDILVLFTPHGALATTHETQGSDMGLFGGFLGWEADAPELIQASQAIKESGIHVDIRIVDYNAPHPSTYKLILKNNSENHELIAISTGGGMIEVLTIDQIPITMTGDFYETLIPFPPDVNPEELKQFLETHGNCEYVIINTHPNQTKTNGFIQIKGRNFPPPALIEELLRRYTIPATSIKSLHPVLPVLSRRHLTVPFITNTQMEHYNADKGLLLWELAVCYESARGGISPDQVVAQMGAIARVMRQSILAGLEGCGSDYSDRILPHQSLLFQASMLGGKMLDGGLLNRIILYTTAMMDMKSSMGLIVAAPTAGSCGALPGACIGAADSLGLGETEITRALLAAGMIGVFIGAHATFSAEVGGCQAECGVASGMAAAALVTLANGTTEQATSAASMALQNSFGMVCDPVAKRVEAPCLGKNVMAASNALACANMALANFNALIPLDEVIDAMDIVGRSIAPELRCTGLGGLSITKSSKKIEKHLANQNFFR